MSMTIIITVILAVSVTVSIMCLVEAAKLHMEKAGEDVYVLDVFRNVLSAKAKRLLAFITAGLFILALSLIAGAVIYSVLFFDTGATLIPAILLALSGGLLYLESRYCIYVRFLFLCCAVKAVTKSPGSADN